MGSETKYTRRRPPGARRVARDGSCWAALGLAMGGAAAAGRYQDDLRIPGSRPCDAISRKVIRESPNLRM